MTVHTLHDDIHDLGLADGCPGCDEHAEQPFVSLDDDNLRTLTWRVETGLPGRSQNESKAMARVKDAIVMAQGLMRSRPVCGAGDTRPEWPRGTKEP